MRQKHRSHKGRNKSGPRENPGIDFGVIPTTGTKNDPLLGPLFNKPKKPKKPPKPPTPQDPAVQAARDAERLKSKRRRGRQASILTGPLGDPSDSAVERKSLLGGG